jgi:hypothetical protein
MMAGEILNGTCRLCGLIALPLLCTDSQANPPSCWPSYVSHQVCCSERVAHMRMEELVIARIETSTVPAPQHVKRVSGPLPHATTPMRMLCLLECTWHAQ